MGRPWSNRLQELSSSATPCITLLPVRGRGVLLQHQLLRNSWTVWRRDDFCFVRHRGWKKTVSSWVQSAPEGLLESSCQNMHPFFLLCFPWCSVAAVRTAIIRHWTRPDHRTLKRGSFQGRNRHNENHQHIVSDTHLAKRKLSLGKAVHPGSGSQARILVWFSALAKCCVHLTWSIQVRVGRQQQCCWSRFWVNHVMWSRLHLYYVN